MNKHYLKKDFHGVSILIIVLEAIAAISLLFSSIGSIVMMIFHIGSITNFIIIAFGGIALSIFVFGFSELLQLLLKIEINTRPSDRSLNAEYKKAMKRLNS